MKNHTVTVSLLSAFAMGLSAATAQAEDVNLDRSSRAFKEAQESLTKSTEVYKAISERKTDKVPASVLDKTKCVAIFPDTVTVSAGIGGSHGDGIGFCKSSAGTWENPMFLNLTGGSIGLQAGVKSADMVFYITGDKAASALRKGSFKVGGELSAVAGKFDKTFEAPQAEVVAYSRTEGLFLGASVDGVSVTRDDSDERAFYGTRETVQTAKMPADLEQKVNEIRDVLPPHVG